MCKTFKNFLGKRDLCNILSKMGVLDKTVFIGTTISLKISEESNKKRYVDVGPVNYILS